METCKCNKCGEEIQIDVQEEVIGQDKEGEDVIEQFLPCPACGQRYTIFISDGFMRKKIAARKRLRRNPKNFNRAIDTSIVNEMQRHLKELKTRYGREG